jgi:predicted DNA-binding protein (MmcQ/YjbR family)
MFAGFYAAGKDATFGCKVPDEDFEAITRIDGIRPAPYAARFFWISVDDPKLLPESEAIALLRGSYDLVKAKLPKKLQAEIAGAKGPAKKKSAKPASATKKARSR